jgi:hypothetical protein
MFKAVLWLNSMSSVQEWRWWARNQGIRRLIQHKHIDNLAVCVPLISWFVTSFFPRIKTTKEAKKTSVRNHVFLFCVTLPSLHLLNYFLSVVSWLFHSCPSSDLQPEMWCRMPSLKTAVKGDDEERDRKGNPRFIQRFSFARQWDTYCPVWYDVVPPVESIWNEASHLMCIPFLICISCSK